jgi:nicotinate-nucleotide adenylyltransferase
MKIGLFFGSFNPIHTGHLIIANIVRETTDMDEIWFVVSPQNPFKTDGNLLPAQDRLDLVREAIHHDYYFRASDVEFSMPRPSYTIDTLTYLADKFPQHTFRLIIGSDNLAQFPKWKNHEAILQHFGLIVYPRPYAGESPLLSHPNVEQIEAPEMDISATIIRKLVKGGRSIKYLVPEGVRELIESRGYFR